MNANFNIIGNKLEILIPRESVSNTESLKYSMNNWLKKNEKQIFYTLSRALENFEDFFGVIQSGISDVSVRDNLVVLTFQLTGNLLQKIGSNNEFNTKGDLEDFAEIINQLLESNILTDFKGSLNESTKTFILPIQKLKLFEGGAAGHMLSVFEDKTLTFKELKRLIDVASRGAFTKENFVTEKIDGVNLFITYYNGELYAVRNKTQMKKGVEGYLNLEGLSKHFEGKGNVQEAFTLAFKDLKKSILSLTDKQRDFIFGKIGKRFINLEIVYPKTEITVPYGDSFIVFHGIINNEDGQDSVLDPEKGRILAGMIKQINQDVQETFSIKGPNVLKFIMKEDSGKKRDTYLNELSKFMVKNNLKDSDTIFQLHKNTISKTFKEKNEELNPTPVSEEILEKFYTRLIDKNVSFYPVNKMKSDGVSKEFINWYKEFEDTSYGKIYTETIFPVKILLIKIGTDLLLSTSNILSFGKTKPVERIKEKIQETLKTMTGPESSEFSERRMEIMNKLFKNISDIGLDKLVPSEGFVIKWEGKLLKFTGLFQLVHAFVSIQKFSK